jgi:hypothetical protein
MGTCRPVSDSASFWARLADDDVVEHLDAEKRSGRGEAAGEGDIFGGRQIAGRVVAREHDGGS